MAMNISRITTATALKTPAAKIDPEAQRLLEELERLALATLAEERGQAALDGSRDNTHTPMRHGSLKLRHLIAAAACAALSLAVVFSPARLAMWTAGALVVGLCVTVADLVVYGED
jgi:type VI protein secretion system component VasF